MGEKDTTTEEKTHTSYGRDTWVSGVFGEWYEGAWYWVRLYEGRLRLVGGAVVGGDWCQALWCGVGGDWCVV